ncbi:hypothetical protein ACFFHH_15195 [Cytobacillus solani]|uniref:hypothetical protein n=1 Tax=Cytobacillus solani TaxID=1637975 RepID=UPI0006ABCEE4|nr:hypothetical protein [Cytobacillus solani]KOP81337.1 hypothetical protein AMS60_01825 [Bacillus sp. FJAT-21945]
MGEISLSTMVISIIQGFFWSSMVNIYLAIKNGNVSLKTPLGEVLTFYLKLTETQLMLSVGLLWIVFKKTELSAKEQLIILIGTLLAIILYEPIKKKVQQKVAEHNEKKIVELIRVYKKIEKENSNKGLDL